MIGLFKRQQRAAPVDTSALGDTAIAMVVAAGSAVAPGCAAVLIDRAGRARRIAAGERFAPAVGEVAWQFRPGPYRCELRPFAAAPEMGLRLTFAIDAPDPRAQQQRFDLYLASEGGSERADGPAVLTCAALYGAIEAALQRELEQGHLELPPCTSLAEWNAFRSGLNRLLYVRFGVTVDECLPVDLGGSVDYAALLAARAAAGPVDVLASQAMTLPVDMSPAPSADTDALALRRLFLELPCLMCALRVAVLPRGQALFQRHQGLLRRLDLVSLGVATMPAYALAAPGVPLDAGNRARRAVHASRACTSLDDAWALLARLQGDDAEDGRAGASDALSAAFDEAERIVANLENDVAGRRASILEEAAP